MEEHFLSAIFYPMVVQMKDIEPQNRENPR